LLSDHAYLERKAASNALDLLNRWPEPGMGPDAWVTHLSAIAHDETQHLHAVLRLIRHRGGVLQRGHKSEYVSDLRKLVRGGEGWQSTLLDRLLVSALTEARSCERFEILAQECPDRELGEFYRNLEASESGHYTIFFTLAKQVSEPTVIETRWNQLLDEEARIIQMQRPGCGIHSGYRR